MKILITLFFVALPAAAQACGGHGMGYGGGYGHGGCGFAPFLLCAVMAALGYWVLQHSGKETAVYVKRTGSTVGLALVIVGLLGLMCTLGSHIKKSMDCRGKCEEQGMMQGGQGGGRGGKMCDMPGMTVDVKVTETEKKKTK